mmetsp:Transcript_22305/g.69677  ORF Transcript_22305/g.69677 Transcript_22305/m.69677 type:complete len:297 (-) Transcript_22305:7-897(-)
MTSAQVARSCCFHAAETTGGCTERRRAPICLSSVPQHQTSELRRESMMTRIDVFEIRPAWPQIAGETQREAGALIRSSPTCPTAGRTAPRLLLRWPWKLCTKCPLKLGNELPIWDSLARLVLSDDLFINVELLGQLILRHLLGHARLLQGLGKVEVNLVVCACGETVSVQEAYVRRCTRTKQQHSAQPRPPAAPRGKRKARGASARTFQLLCLGVELGCVDPRPAGHSRVLPSGVLLRGLDYTALTQCSVELLLVGCTWRLMRLVGEGHGVPVLVSHGGSWVLPRLGFCQCSRQYF